MKRAMLFPGQGSEAPGMGGALLSRPGPVRELLAYASQVLGTDLAALVTRGDAALRRTEISQPALAAVCIGTAREWLDSGLNVDVVAGHSVGELAAFAVAGCLTPEAAIDVAIARGAAMGAAARHSPGGMVAVRVRSEAEVEDVLALARTAGRASLAAHNGPEEWVLSGERAALAAAATRFPTVPLPVAGPWHSEAMSAAEPALRRVLMRITLKTPEIPLVANREGRFVTASDDLPELLVGQLTRPVRWAETMRTLADCAIGEWLTVGPGKVLRGFVRANVDLHARVVAADGPPAQEMRA